jgi:hypothetical protein
MGWTFYYIGKIDPEWKTSPMRREYVDLILSTSIAYGAMGWLIKEFDPSTAFGLEAMVRSYYMMQQLQQQYAFARPRKIEFADTSGKYFSSSEAHANGVIESSRVHVVYENGTEVYVNRGKTGVWPVADDKGRTVELPPSGWLVFNTSNGFHEVSAIVGGRRIDHVVSAGYEFLDSRGQWTVRGNLGASGAVVLKQEASDVLRLIDLHGNDRIRFSSSAGGRLMAYDADGQSLGDVEFTLPDPGWVEFKPLPKARSYIYAK